MVVHELWCNFIYLPARTKFCLSRRASPWRVSTRAAPCSQCPGCSSAAPLRHFHLDVTWDHTLRSGVRAGLSSSREIQRIRLYPPASLGFLSPHNPMYSSLRRMTSLTRVKHLSYVVLGFVSGSLCTCVLL